MKNPVVRFPRATKNGANEKWYDLTGFSSTETGAGLVRTEEPIIPFEGHDGGVRNGRF